MADIKIDKIIRSRRRSVALVVMPDASIVIRAPIGVSVDYIENFVRQKSLWIEKKQQYVSKFAKNRRPKNFVNGEKFYLAGAEFSLNIVQGLKPSVWLDENLNMTEACLQKPHKYIEHWYGLQAKNKIPERVKYYSRLTGLKYKSVRINRAKTRWGSCGHKNTLNFSWRLIMAPLEIIDYVIMHELVHTEIKNHSEKFYFRLGELMPDYKTREKWFKSNLGFADL